MTTLLKMIMVITLMGLFSCNEKAKNSKDEFDTEYLEKASSFELITWKPISNTTIEKLSAFIAPANSPVCSVIPTQAQVNHGQWTFKDHFYSASQAAKIGIPIININASHDLKVYVKDYRRTATCMASDNSTNVLYGQVIRTVIEIENYDASVGIDLASIAANGTLKKNTQHFYFYKDGFYNPKIDDILAEVQGKTFDVQNYALYQSAMGNLIKLLKEPNTTFSANRIGIEEEIGSGENDELFVKSPIIAYALMSINNKNSCNKTKEKFQDNKMALDLITSVYKSLNIPIANEKPSEEAVLKSKRYLQGVKVKS